MYKQENPPEAQRRATSEQYPVKTPSLHMEPPLKTHNHEHQKKPRHWL